MIILAWHMFCTSNNYGVWPNGVGQNRETDEEHDEDFVEEEFQLAKVKFDKDGRVDSEEALGLRVSIL